jgi:chromosome partitioning protein
MRSIAIVNQKGGSGKTTTAVNLAAALGENDRCVLVMDLDPQASASNWYGAKDAGKGLLEVFTDGRDLASLVQKTEAPGVSIVPSSSWLVGIEKALAGEVGTETILRPKVAALKGWDYILLDCPPTLGTLTVNALTSAEEVLVPVESHVMALNGLVQLIATVNAVKERLHPPLRIAGVLACRVDARTRHALEVVEQLREKFGCLVYRAIIRENIRLAECPSFGVPITQYDTNSHGAEDYRALAGEVIEQEEERIQHGTPKA